MFIQAGSEMALPFFIENSQYLLICLTVSSRKNYTITPCFSGDFSFHIQGISDLRLLLSINGCESFLKVQGVRYTF